MSEQVITPESTIELAAFRTPEIKSLISKNKEQNWKVATEPISNQDIYEFAARRNIATTLHEISNKLANLKVDPYTKKKENLYSRDKAEEIFESVTTKPEANLTHPQKEILKKAEKTILNRVDELNDWLEENGMEELESLLYKTLKTKDVNQAAIRYDTKLPGVIVVKIIYPGEYKKIDKTGSLGIFPDLGDGILKDRLLVINEAKDDGQTIRHEYQHFLFQHASKDFENQNNTYSEPELKTAFADIKNEFMAQTAAGHNRKLDNYFNEALEKTKESTNYDAFKKEVDLLKQTFEDALKKNLSWDKIGFLVGSSRNLTQAAKFIFLETQLSLPSIVEK